MCLINAHCYIVSIVYEMLQLKIAFLEIAQCPF